MNVLYLCDKKACDKCNPECHHTEDIEHAVNFKKDPEGNYWEQNRFNYCNLVVPDYMEVIGKDPIFFGEEKESCQSTTEPAQTAEPT